MPYGQRASSISWQTLKGGWPRHGKAPAAGLFTILRAGCRSSHFSPASTWFHSIAWFSSRVGAPSGEKNLRVHPASHVGDVVHPRRAARHTAPTPHDRPPPRVGRLQTIGFGQAIEREVAKQCISTTVDEALFQSAVSDEGQPVPLFGASTLRPETLHAHASRSRRSDQSASG